MQLWKKWLVVAGFASVCTSVISATAGLPQHGSRQAHPLTSNTSTALSPTSQSSSTPINSQQQNVSLSSEQLGLVGPLSVGINYNSVSNYFVNASFAKRIIDAFALGALAEYGPDMYRLGATLGFQVSAQGQLKFSAERLNQQLPFSFDSGNIDKRVAQNAYGVDYQYNFLNNDQPFRDIDIGGYYANTPNIALNSVTFLSNGVNCSAAAGLYCINDRNIAGASAKGVKLGSDVNLSQATQLNTTVNYDHVKYNTIYTSTSSYDSSGFGGGVGLTHLFTSQFKVATDASVREIYNTYDIAFSWLPARFTSLGLELSLIGQRLISRNSTPNNSAIGVQVTLTPDMTTVTNQHLQYTLDNTAQNTNLESFVKTPAVYMDRVLAIGEQQTRLSAPTVSSLSPSSGVVSGGTTVTISGTNFLTPSLASHPHLLTAPPPATTVTFCGTAGTSVNVASDHLSLKVVAPAHAAAVCDVVVSTSAGSTTYENAFTYTGSSAPTITDLSPTSGTTAGGTTITLSGTHLTGTTAVTFGGTAGTSVSVVSDSSVTVVSPAHAAGTVDIVITTPDGSATEASGFTYASPFLGTLTACQGGNEENSFNWVTCTGTGITGNYYGANADTGPTVSVMQWVGGTCPAAEGHFTGTNNTRVLYSASDSDTESLNNGDGIDFAGCQVRLCTDTNCTTTTNTITVTAPI